MAHALSTRPTHSVRNLTTAVLVVWFLLALGGSLLGVFDSESRTPLPPEDVRGVERAGEPRSGDGRDPWGSGLRNARGRPGRGGDHPTDGPVPPELHPDVLRAAVSAISPDLLDPCREGNALTSGS